MQFKGECRDGKVGLQFYRTDTGDCTGADLDAYHCAECNRPHRLVGIAYRRPVDMLGCWVRFRYNGEIHAPDLSCGIAVPRWPIGTKVLSEAESSAIWHS